MTRCRAAIVAALLMSTGWRVGAWGPQGHRLVASLAAEALSPAARQNVAWLLDDQTLADVSSWADRYHQGNYQTFYWHFVNIPRDAAAYDRDRDCPRQPGVAAGSFADRWRDCVVDRIEYNRERVGDPKLDRADRAVSLKFLVHLVGDLHQPFHALGVERGGNGIVVSAFGSDDCSDDPARVYPCNLHGIWDSVLIARRRLNDAQYLELLRRLIRTDGLKAEAGGSAADWAMQSHALARSGLVAQRRNIDEAYYRAHITIVDRRLALGGVRLAALLNQSLSTAPRSR
jgi:hypothetical protein